MSAPFDRVLAALGDRVRRRTDCSATARCPAHDDRGPSLSISVGNDGRALLHCFTGCPPDAVLAALGLRATDLFADEPRRNGHAVPRPPRPGKPARDWSAAAERCRAALTPEGREALAQRLPVAPEALDALGTGWATPDDLREWRAGGADGWSRDEGAWTTPERDGELRVVGLTLRTPKNAKGCPGGAQRGLVVPANLDDLPDPVLIVEGASDAAACLTVGLAAVGRPSNRGRADHLARLLDGREVLVVGEHDGPRPDGSWPGRDGAQHVARDLARAWGRPVEWTLPSEGAKDVREWVAARVADGLDLADREACIDAGTVLLRDLREVAEWDEPAKAADPVGVERMVAAVAAEPREAGRTPPRQPAGGGGTEKPPLRWRDLDGLRALAAARMARWIVHGIIACGAVTLFGARAKAGKTTLLAALLSAVERGLAFAGFSTSQATCLYLSEESADLLAKRAEFFGLQGAGYLAREDFDSRYSFADFIAAGAEECVRRGASVLVIDTFARFARLGPEAEKDAGHAQAIMDAASAAAAQGLAVVLVAHIRKGDGEEGEAIRGSSAFGGAADIVVELRRTTDPRSTARTLTCYSRYSESPTEPVTVELLADGRTYARLEEGPARERESQAAQTKILEVLRRHGPLTKDDLFERVGLRAKDMRDALRLLKDRRSVTWTGRGRAGDPRLYSWVDPASERPVGPGGPEGVPDPPAAAGSVRGVPPCKEWDPRTYPARHDGGQHASDLADRDLDIDAPGELVYFGGPIHDLAPDPEREAIRRCERNAQAAARGTVEEVEH